MKLKILVLAIAAIALAGCAAMEQRVEQAQREAEQAVTAKVDEATAAAQQKATQAAEQAKQDVLKQVDPQGVVQGAAARAQETQAMLSKVQQGEVFDPAVRQWIERTLADASQSVRATAIPVMNAAYEKFPESRKWLETEARKAMQGAEGPALAAWQKALDTWTRIQSVAEAQR